MSDASGGPLGDSGEGPADSFALIERARRFEPVVAQRLAEVRARIERAGGDPGKVQIVGVTKTFGPEYALAGLLAGIGDLGENYAEELSHKAAVLGEIGSPPVRWHFIGTIQRNKIRRIVGVVSCWQSVSRAAEAEAIAARSGELRPGVFVEVNVANDPARPGCPPSSVPGLVGMITATGLEVRGLMAVAPLGEGPDTARTAFEEVARLRAEAGLAELSIGMSGDLEAAVGAGTTMVRIGTALFGSRNHHARR